MGYRLLDKMAAKDKSALKNKAEEILRDLEKL
jgi:hypothetical protein